MTILTLETTCDETAAAVVTDRLEVLSSVVASQDDLHRRFGGVVPEIASRAHVQRILPVIDEALRTAGLKLADLDAVAVANTPGLAGSLLVGLVAAKALCVAGEIPLVAVNHLQAHIYACRLASREEVFPCVGLIVSGGHTSLYRCGGPLEFELLGSTIDDAAGEAFDKVAGMLGLPYPGGPSIERAARRGNPRAYRFPRAFLKDEERLDFSFSGLKTAVRYSIARLLGQQEPSGRKGTVPFSLRENWDSPQVTSRKGTVPFSLRENWDSPQVTSRKGTVPFSLRENRDSPQATSPHVTSQVADLAASFQEAVVDCLVGKAFAAVRQTGLPTLCVGGGVAANARLRQRLAEQADRQGIRLHVAPIGLCTDNAVMGAIAVERLRVGLIEDLDLDVYPGVVRKPA